MINILPKEQKKDLKYEYHMRLFSVIFIMLAILGIFATILIIPSYFFSKSKEVLIEKKLEDFNKNNPEIKVGDLNKITLDVNTKLKTLDNTWPNDLDTYDTFNQVLSTIPSGITITQFLYNEENEGTTALQINGNATSREVLQNFKTTLQSNTKFSDVNLPISDFVKKSDINFSISFSVK